VTNPGLPPRPPAGPSPRPTTNPGAAAAKSGAGLGDTQMKALYDAFVSAKKRCKEDVSKLSFESVAKSVQKQIPELMQKHKAKSIDFKVVIKDGKAILKAVPRG
jgi:hypothetical protein